MAEYKFWETQPVPQFSEVARDDSEEGPVVTISPHTFSREPVPLLEGYAWSDIDLEDGSKLCELYDLLEKHYVTDDDDMFRFHYSLACLQWALQPPGWKPSWNVGVRECDSGALVACITAIPVELRVKERTLSVAEVNFLCVHQTLRFMRLTPVLVREITRRCARDGLSQAVYTSGSVLPRPFSSARYYHRSLNPEKLIAVGFSFVPPRSTIEEEVKRFEVPVETATPGLRPMTNADIPAVQVLLTRYLARYDVAPIFTEDEIRHHLLFNKLDDDTGKPIVQAYVVENSETCSITDVVSFFLLPCTVLQNESYNNLNAAYCSYYASTAAWDEGQDLKARLLALVRDVLVLAKKIGCDVFNAVTNADNSLFLSADELGFGPGDGALHYYLYNYRTAYVAGGVDAYNRADGLMGQGVGLVMI
ncbi:N-myristoyl transferase [Nemania sp. FL0916]|nr:N-myristoyl transferase [Nemania sp. FL0916]